MKQAIVILCLMLLVSLVFGQHTPDNIIGKWKAEDGRVITISKSNQQVTGLDYKNRPCLYNIHLDEGVWKGTVENHDEGKKADCEIYLQDAKLKIVAHKGFFSKTFIWVKV